ncbi:MAG TPA: AMP-binding protein [Acidimicrobiales bacterium]|nr:AMP-binding protein [Acidimicrobiales bacterium]
MELTAAAARFREARDLLLEHRSDPLTARRRFSWPELDEFNWALEWFDAVGRESDRPALRIVAEDGSETQRSYAEMTAASNRVANFLRAEGVGRGDVLLLMLGNELELWETILAAMKLGATLVPTSTLCTPTDLADRVARGGATHVVAGAASAEKFADIGGFKGIAVGDEVAGWAPYGGAAAAASEFAPDGVTHAGDPLLYYFTSGTTAKPKLVEHTYASYPVGHLSTLYWVGLRPGDAHLNVSSPGWAKHAWSSVFAPWNAEATVVVFNYARFEARRLLEALGRVGVSTFCAPPTVWRMLIQEELAAFPVQVREAVSAGEPLNPEVIEAVARAWGITVRDGFGQTETTAVIGNPPGVALQLGSMGRPLPGYDVVLLDPADGREGDEGEICITAEPRPLGLMVGYRDGEGAPLVPADRFHHTGDVARRDAEGYITYIGRADDVFKASDYRISPFELESVLIEHEAVAEAAVVPAPDPVRLALPKAYVTLAAGHEPSAETARSILAHCRAVLPPYKRVRRLEFAELPKTISGKIRRVELREAERARSARGAAEFYEEDFPDLAH